MYPIDVPLGFKESWRLIISVYPPVSVDTLQAALGGGYPGAPSMYPTTREVRVNPQKECVEIWERQVMPETRIVTDPRGKPGSLNIREA